ncbi:ABC transporter substrate-binding protein [Mycoplasma sp. Mirounga ES2805-ORL]|uniref:ABC transporter substrate-binding protein n=1 Tax=Mycoplasma sp. Mirounga ES2805-ORL TaxID=754514 RepID=UPI00197BF62F|nr:ABC transporter substrate-binding protein [Mycoplasma sp. Mirounga ES2805-ORL]QSF13726.1 ABC transporter substrate-binding protein [Mycoplasma sp. Mirounga ES2805-ORL]
MKKNIKKMLFLSSITTSLVSTTLLSSSCNKIDYDFGLVTDPINSLNYIKYGSVNKLLPSLVESPIKQGPNPIVKAIKSRSLPKLPLGIYIDSNIDNVEDFVSKYPNPDNSGSSYDLKDLDAAPGSIDTTSTQFLPVNSILTSSNKFLSSAVQLNRGQSKWSNGDVVTADDYIDAMHYILDINTGSQKQTSILQRKFKGSQELIEAQNEYIRKHKVGYQNPFGYPKLKKENGKYVYDVFNENYKPWSSQNKDDEAEVLKIKKAALNLGFYSARMYWNYDNKTILSSIPYSPDFNFDDEITILMLPNPEYSLKFHTQEELKSIPERIATKVRRYPYFDPYQIQSDKFNKLLDQANTLKRKMNSSIIYDELNKAAYNKELNTLYKELFASTNENTLTNEFVKNLDSRLYFTNRLLALDEYTLRIEYDSYQPTGLSNALEDIKTVITPVNRKFIESIGGISEFGLNKRSFLTSGPFTIGELVLGPQGYLILNKNNEYYSANDTISNKIKIFFSNNPNINSAMYSDGYIAATKIPAIEQWKYWENPKTRKYMKKSHGFGTIALAFNLDDETNGAANYSEISTNSSSPVNDQDLRNAIYYAIDRNAMLNIVGWNSSFPVITWTAFGNASSSNGDAVETGFDHDYMYTKYGKYPEKIKANSYLNDSDYANSKAESISNGWGIPIPVQNYSHIDHLAKTMQFENVDRTDKAFHLEVARAFWEHYKKKTGKNSVTLRFISNSTDEQKNASLALSDFMNKAFNGEIQIDVKSLPENVYEDYRTTGKYDLIYRNFDTFGSDVYSYVRTFMKPDEINSNEQKTTGFRNNPSGSWTYEKYFKDLGYYYNLLSETVMIKPGHLNEIENTRKRLRIQKDIWTKMVELSIVKRLDKNDISHELITDYTKRYMKFFSNTFTSEEEKQKWTEKKVFAVITGFEKIVREAAPVVPLMEVDTYWEISRVNGVASLYSYSLQYAYDIARPPISNLPLELK